MQPEYYTFLMKITENKSAVKALSKIKDSETEQEIF